MKRRATKVIVFLLALLVGGAIVNVGVTWGCALRPWRGGDPMVSLTPPSSSDVEWWNTNVRTPEAGHKMNSHWEFFSLGRELTQFNSNFNPSAFRQRSGLPFYCMEKFQITGPVGPFALRSRKKYLAWWPVPQIQTVPTCPLPIPFAINTIFYAAVLWVLFAAPGAMRRRVRRKRGKCAACGYSLQERVSDKCPECGAPA